MTIADTFTIDRGPRAYEVAVHYDQDAENPRDWSDHDATEFLVVSYTYNRWDTYVDELSGDAGNALKHFVERYGYHESDDIERAFGKWRAITGSSVVLVTGSDHGYSQGDWHNWFALVDTAVLVRDGYGATAQEVATAEADEYAAWAYGDVFGVVVSLGESEIDGSLWGWGIIDRKGDYVRSVANDIVDEHEARLHREAQKNGAGFVGVL